MSCTVTTTACFIVRTLTTSPRACVLLVAMLIVTLSVGVTRLALLIEFLRLAKMVTLGTTGCTVAAKLDDMNTPVVLLSEFEVILSAIVSCIPGLRAWSRSRNRQNDKQDTERGGLGHPSSLGSTDSRSEGPDSIEGDCGVWIEEK